MSCFKYDMRISIARIPNTKDWAKGKKKLLCLPHYTILCPMLNHKTLKNLHPWYTYIHINIIFADLIYPTPNYKNKNEPKMKRAVEKSWHNWYCICQFRYLCLLIRFNFAPPSYIKPVICGAYHQNAPTGYSFFQSFLAKLYITRIQNLHTSFSFPLLIGFISS